MIRVQASRLFDGETFRDQATVVLDGPNIAAIGGEEADQRLPADWLLVPGFVDLQVNGAGDVLFNDTTSAAGLGAIAAALARLGTTSFLPTLISARDKIAPALAASAAAMAAGVAGVVGTHIEGPFLNPKRRGVHPAAAIVTMQDADVAGLTEQHDGALVLTLAPECVAPEHITRLAESGVRVFIGHSDAEFAQATAGLTAGAVGFTHLFNAMSQFAGRAPGCVGAALAHPGAAAGIICDGLHVHPAAIRVAHAALGPERLFLVSDAMPTVGGANGSFFWDGETIALRGDRLTRADGTLAGAHLTMAQAVARAVRLCDLPLAHALRMATATPARIAGVAGKVGRIAPGLRVDLVALDPDLAVVAVWQAGARIV